MTEEERRLAELLPTVDRADVHDGVLTIRCPQCYALEGEPCLASFGGSRRTHHRERVAEGLRLSLRAPDSAIA